MLRLIAVSSAISDVQASGSSTYFLNSQEHTSISKAVHLYNFQTGPDPESCDKESSCEGSISSVK